MEAIEQQNHPLDRKEEEEKDGGEEMVVEDLVDSQSLINPRLHTDMHDPFQPWGDLPDDHVLKLHSSRIHRFRKLLARVACADRSECIAFMGDFTIRIMPPKNSSEPIIRIPIRKYVYCLYNDTSPTEKTLSIKQTCPSNGVIYRRVDKQRRPFCLQESKSNVPDTEESTLISDYTGRIYKEEPCSKIICINPHHLHPTIPNRAYGRAKRERERRRARIERGDKHPDEYLLFDGIYIPKHVFRRSGFKMRANGDQSSDEDSEDDDYAFITI